MISKVILHPAYMFDCDNCGRENFVRAVLPEMSPEDEQRLREDEGVESYEEGHWVTYPDKVECFHCGADFETIHQVNDEDD